MNLEVPVIGILRGIEFSFFRSVMEVSFDAGIAAAGVGASLFGREALEERDMEKIAHNVSNFISLCPDMKK